MHVHVYTWYQHTHKPYLETPGSSWYQSMPFLSFLLEWKFVERRDLLTTVLLTTESSVPRAIFCMKLNEWSYTDALLFPICTMSCLWQTSANCKHPFHEQPPGSHCFIRCHSLGVANKQQYEVHLPFILHMPDITVDLRHHQKFVLHHHPDFLKMQTAPTIQE